MKPLNYSHEHTIEVSSRRRALFPKDENTSDSDLDCIKSLSSDSESDLDDRQFHSNIDDYDIIGVVDSTTSDRIGQQSNGTPQHPKLSNDFVLKETPTQRYNKTPQDAVNPSKLPKLIRNNQPKLPLIEKFPIEKNPKVRTALFQEFDMSLSTHSFYPKTTKSPLNSSKLLNRQFIEKKRETHTKQRETLYLCNRRLRRKIGVINAGVRHRIKKPKVRPHRDNKAILQAALNILENSPLNDYLSDCNQSIVKEDNVDIENRAPDIDTNRKFFKSPTRKGIVTVSDNIRVEINNGKMNLIENKKKRPRVQHSNNANQTKRLKVSGQSFDLDNQPETLINTNQIEDLIKQLDEQDNGENVEKREKDAADLIMSPTSQMCNMTSGLALNSPKRANRNLLPVLDNLPSTSDENKYYPVFYPRKLDVDKKRSLDSTSLSSPKNPKKFKQLSKDQMLLDAGQKRFGLTECGECKFIYHLGDPSDEIIHLNYHEARHLFRFNGWRNERTVFNQTNNNKERIIQITPTDPKLWWKKCMDLLEFVNRDLGFYEMGMNFNETSQVFLYIKNRTIIGILLAEMQQFGYRLLTTHLDQIDLCSEESYPIKCGIARIWVATNHRQQGVGSALIDSLKRNFVYGYLLKNDEIAFSSPTEMGKLFAKNYFKTPNFLIYM